MNRLPSRRPNPPPNPYPPAPSSPGSKLKLATVQGEKILSFFANERSEKLFSALWRERRRRRKKNFPAALRHREKHRRCGGKSSVAWNTCIKPDVANKRTNWPLQSSDAVDTWTACQSERTTQEGWGLFFSFFPPLHWGDLGSWV